MAHSRRTTAAAIIIGNELLSGKVADTNTPLLIALLREVGVCLRRIVVMADDTVALAKEIRSCAEQFDYVVTSGGVGPTHDDLTMEAVALAFDRGLVTEPRIEELIRRHWGARTNTAALKLARLPEGATLVESPDSMIPLVRFQNIFILPGIPQLFRAKLRAVRPLLEGAACHLSRVFISSDESVVADHVGAVAAANPALEVGSYPRFGDADYSVMLTIEGDDSGLVARATRDLLAGLPPGAVLRVETVPGKS